MIVVKSFLTQPTLPPLYIGQLYEGGYIAYLDSTGEHGFVCATVDQASFPGQASWGCCCTCPDCAPSATGSAIGTGGSNTAAIISECQTVNSAAALCVNYTGGGYTDWVLPSTGELTQLYNNKSVLNITPHTTWYYWSSRQFSAGGAYLIYMGDGSISTNSKLFNFSVRAIRYF